MTPDSTLIPYLSVNGMIARCDIRIISQLSSDDPINPIGYIGTPPNAVFDIPTATAELQTNVNLLTAINDACGEIEAACLRANMYTPVDLLALTGASQGYLQKTIAAIAMMGLYNRRMGPQPSESCVNNYNKAMKDLEDLSNGTRIFGFIEVQAAGLPKTIPIPPSQYWQNNLVSARYYRAFGNRQDIRRYSGW